MVGDSFKYSFWYNSSEPLSQQTRKTILKLANIWNKSFFTFPETSPGAAVQAGQCGGNTGLRF